MKNNIKEINCASDFGSPFTNEVVSDSGSTSIICVITQNEPASTEHNCNGNISDVSVSTSLAPKDIDNEIQRTIRYLDDNFRGRFISLIHTETFEPGVSNGTITFVKSLFRYGENAVVNWICRLYKDYLNNASILSGLLNIAIYYKEAFESVDVIMALAALSNKSQEVKELGIRLLESDCCVEHYNTLKSIHCEEKWIMDYVNKLIEDFQKELCLR